MSIILKDAWENDVEFNVNYIRHRDRIIMTSFIQTFRVKNRRLLVNQIQANQHLPTMIVFFNDHEKAIEALNSLLKCMVTY